MQGSHERSGEKKKEKMQKKSEREDVKQVRVMGILKGQTAKGGWYANGPSPNMGRKEIRGIR